MDAWNQLGSVPPKELSKARLEIHHAAQLPAIAVGRALARSRDDDSHTALTWLDVAARWVGEKVPDTGGIRAGLRPAELVLTLGGKDDPSGEQLDLVGLNREAALDWLRECLTRHGVERSRVVYKPHYDLPEHPIDRGAAWTDDHAAARAELSHWYAVASALLAELTLDRDSSPILTWPHHFDIATLIDLGDGKQIGVGLSPGDESYDEPYWYLSPLPRPKTSDLPDLPAGGWHTKGYLAAILTATELLESDDPAEGSRAFLHAAMEAGQKLLGA